METKVYYVLWDGSPAVLNGAAWWWNGKEWVEGSHAEIGHEAKLISKETFEQLTAGFPPHPAIPAIPV
jgi:hypothetical protein